MVIDDAGHTGETTAAALKALAKFVPPGGFYVVEDGCVDIEEMRPAEWAGQTWGGVTVAVDEWLSTGEGSQFRRRRDLELYGMTCHPGGFLQRVG